MVIYCTKCWKENPAGSRVCQRCGAKPPPLKTTSPFPSGEGGQGGEVNKQSLRVRNAGIVGSPSWIRTNNLAVNSRPLYR